MAQGEKKLSRREKKYLAKKDAIIKSAIEKFSVKGYTHTSIEEIAEGADFGKGSIYHYFTCKEEILNEIVSKKTDELMTLMDSISISDIPPLSKLEKLIDTIMRFFHDNLEYFIITIQHFIPFQSSPTLSPYSPYLKFQSFYEKQNIILSNILRDAQLRNHIIPMDIQEMATILTGMINYSILYWIKNRPSKDFVEWMNLGKIENSTVDYFSKRVQVLIRIFLNGVKHNVSENNDPITNQT